MLLKPLVEPLTLTWLLLYLLLCGLDFLFDALQIVIVVLYIIHDVAFSVELRRHKCSCLLLSVY